MNISLLLSHHSAVNTAMPRQPDPVTNAGATSEWNTVNRARQTFIDHAEQAFKNEAMSVDGKKMVDAVTSPGSRAAPGVQVATFAVDGVQAKNIIVIKRVPATVEMSRFS